MILLHPSNCKFPIGWYEVWIDWLKPHAVSKILTNITLLKHY